MTSGEPHSCSALIIIVPLIHLPPHYNLKIWSYESRCTKGESNRPIHNPSRRELNNPTLTLIRNPYSTESIILHPPLPFPPLPSFPPQLPLTLGRSSLRSSAIAPTPSFSLTPRVDIPNHVVSGTLCSLVQILWVVEPRYSHIVGEEVIPIDTSEPRELRDC